MKSRASAGIDFTNSDSHGTETEDVLSPSEDDPINKTTSFKGALNQYIHTSPAKSEAKRKPDYHSDPENPDNSSIQPGSKRKKAARLSSLSRRTILTRSVSASSRSSSTPIPASESQSPTSQPSTPLLPEPGSRTRSRASRRQNHAVVATTTTTTTSRAEKGPGTGISLLQDTIPPNLTLLLVGVNPGIMTGATGFAYAHPSNLFWKLLHSSGITPIRHPPSDTYRLPELYNIGNTNIVARATRDASMLKKAEMDAGVPILEAKIAAKRPQAVCLVGKSIWEAVWRVRKGKPISKEEFRYGWQDEKENMGQVKGEDGWKGARVFVATTTSGLAAHMTVAEKQAVWNELGAWVVSQREAAKN